MAKKLTQKKMKKMVASFASAYLLSAGEKVMSLKSGKGEFLELEIKSKVL